MPIFLGHNPLIVSETTLSLTREPDERADVIEQEDHYLIWQNMVRWNVIKFSLVITFLLFTCRLALVSFPRQWT